MALLIGGPKDGEIMEVNGLPNTLRVPVPNDRDEVALMLHYSIVKVNLFGAPLRVWALDGLPEATVNGLAANHLLNQLALALISETRG